jgi:hercynine metabolism protein
MGTWFDDLEARLNQQLEAFLQANPAQQTRLEQQEAQERQEQLGRTRLQLQQQAQQQRQALLELAGEIRQWQQRSTKARQAGAADLASRAEAHVAQLMLQGRQRCARVEAELEQLGSNRTSTGRDLESEWAAFEAEQELERLRRRQQG